MVVAVTFPVSPDVLLPPTMLVKGFSDEDSVVVDAVVFDDLVLALALTPEAVLVAKLLPSKSEGRVTGAVFPAVSRLSDPVRVRMLCAEDSCAAASPVRQRRWRNMRCCFIVVMD